MCLGQEVQLVVFDGRGKYRDEERPYFRTSKGNNDNQRNVARRVHHRGKSYNVQAYTNCTCSKHLISLPE